MNQKFRTLIALIALPFASTAMAQEPIQIQSLGSATAACYVDTPAYDITTPNYCSSDITTATTTTVFSVLGIDQNSGQYTITYLDGTCDSISEFVQVGLACFRTIRRNQSLTQRVRVTDNYNSSSVILSATATANSGF